MTFARVLARCLTTTALGFVFAAAAAAQPTIGGVVNGASFQALVGPGCVVSIFGTELASPTRSATTVPLPTILDDVSVTVNGIPAPLFFVSPEQINAQFPLELDGDRATVVVTTSQGQSAPFVVALQPTAPGIFTASADGRGVPLLLDTNFRVIESVGPGERAVLYATGLGPTSPAGTTGEGGAGAEPFNRLNEMPEVYIGGRPATVEFAGLAPGFVGLFQLNIVGPDAILGTRTYLIAGGRSSNATNINASFPDPVRGSYVLVTETREVG